MSAYRAATRSGIGRSARVLSVLCALALCALASPVFGSTGEEQVIRAVVRDYLEGADDQDGSRVARSLRDDVLHASQLPDGRLAVVDKAAYVGAIEAKQLGGVPRRIEFHDVDITGGVAQVKVVAVSSTLHFTYYMALTRDENGWAIQSTVSSIRSVE